MQFIQAKKSQTKLRLGLVGISGSGKTYSALKIAKGLGARIAVIDTEHGSAAKYAGDVADFDVLTLDTYSPLTYVKAIQAASASGYDVLVIDSLSHAWMGKDGALDQVEKERARQGARGGGGNSFTAWRDVTPQHNALIEAMLACKCHLIATMRAKTEYVMETNERGKQVPRKVGIQPVQRDGMEYEFDVVADIDQDHRLIVSKTRCSALDHAVIPNPGEDVALMLRQWLSDGAPPAEKPAGALETLLSALRRVTSYEELEAGRQRANELRGTLSRAEQASVRDAIQDAEARLREAEEADRALSSPLPSN